MFKFKGISSQDMQVIIEEEELFIAKAAQRYETIEIEGKDGAYYEEKGYSDVERPIRVQCLNINKMDDILAWLNGVGEFEYKGRKTIARFYSQADPERVACIRVIDMMFIRAPFWYKANEEYTLIKDRKDRTTESAEEHEITGCAGINGELFIDSGKIEQKTYEGYNLLKINETNWKLSEDNWIINKAQNASVRLDDGGIPINAGQTIYYFLLLNSKPSKATTFSISFNNATIGTTILSGMEQKELNTLYSGSYTASEDGIITLKMYGNANSETFKFRIWFSMDNTKTIYEPYVGGTASPNPDYPQDIVSVGSNVNELDITLQSGSSNGVTYQVNPDKSITLNGRASAYFQLVLFEGSKNLKKGTYTINLGNKQSGINLLGVENGTEVAYLTAATSNKYIVRELAIDTTLTAVKSAITNGTVFNNFTIYPKIEKGNKATGYSKHGAGSISFLLKSKNEAPNNMESQVLNGLTFIKNLDGTIKVNGTANANINLTICSNLELEDGVQYKLSGCPANGSTSTYYLQLNQYYSGSSHYSIDIGDGINFDYNIASKNSNSVTIVIRNGVTLNNLIFKPMIIKASISDISYSKYDRQIITVPLPVGIDLCNEDTIINQNGKYYKYNDVAEYIFTGNENWGDYSAYWGSNSFGIPTSILNGTPRAFAEIFSNYFKGYASSTTKNLENEIVIGSINLIMNNANISTAAGLKSWLAQKYADGTPVKIKYKLATPTLTEITDTDTLEGLYQIEHLLMHEGYTLIECTDEVKPGTHVEYFLITDETMDNQGNENSQPIIRLERTNFDEVEITINNVRFKYNFNGNGEEYVEIDCEEKTVKYEGLNRNRNIIIGYDFPKLEVGQNAIKMHEGDCIIKAIRKDRWL